MKKNGGAQFATLNKVVRVGHIAMVAFQQGLEGAEGVSHAGIKAGGRVIKRDASAKALRSPGVLGNSRKQCV